MDSDAHPDHHAAMGELTHFFSSQRWTLLLPWALSLTVGAGLGLGCAEPGANDDCPAGSLLCTCNAGECNVGLECLAGYCVETGGETTGDGDGDGTGDGDGDNPCEDGQSFCGSKCVDTETNVLNCGGCNIECDLGEGCVAGACAQSCASEPCAGFTYCEPNDQLCLPGCEYDEQCESSEVCDVGSHTCICAPDYVLCGGECTPEIEPCAEECGNEAIDPGEACDGSNLDGQACTDLGWDGGTLACEADCTFDEANCTNLICGNNTIDPGEECDGDNLDGEDCDSQGFLSGELGCSNCSFDTSACSDGYGDCCTAKQTPSCEVNWVAECVCEYDPGCCFVSWTNSCVNWATDFCTVECP